MPLPETGYVRLPAVLAVIPVSRTVWFEGMKSGRFPKGVLITPGCRAWSVDSIRSLIDDLEAAL